MATPDPSLVSSESRPLLPVEIWQLILSYIPEKKELAKLCRVSWSLFHLCVKRLYNSVEIKSAVVDDPYSLNLAPFYIAWLAPTDLDPWAQVQHLKFATEHVHSLDHICRHPSYDNIGVQFQFEKFLGRLATRSLRSFTWDMVTCLPRYFTSRQFLQAASDIEQIFLRTDSLCSEEGKIPLIRSLDLFPKLRKVIWMGINLRRYQIGLLRWFKTDLSLVEHLELDFTPAVYECHMLSYKPPPDFYKSVLLADGPLPRKFDNLRVLGLSGISLATGRRRLLRFFNFSKLDTLKLKRCRDVPLFFKVIAKLRVDMSRLKTFEYSSDHEPNDFSQTEDVQLAKFIERLENLENLYLSIPNDPVTPMPHLYSISEHKGALRRFGYRPFEFSSREMNNCWGTFFPDYLSLPFRDVLRESDLQCLRVGAFFFRLSHRYLKNWLSHTVTFIHADMPRRTISPMELSTRRRVLDALDPEADSGYRRYESTRLNPWNLVNPEHTYKSFVYIKLLLMAQWMFLPEPDGLPNLKVLAWGDFSTTLWQDNAILLCRNPDYKGETAARFQDRISFRVLDQTITDVWRFKEEMDDFLTALPD